MGSDSGSREECGLVFRMVSSRIYRDETGRQVLATTPVSDCYTFSSFKLTGFSSPPNFGSPRPRTTGWATKRNTSTRLAANCPMLPDRCPSLSSSVQRSRRSLRRPPSESRSLDAQSGVSKWAKKRPYKDKSCAPWHVARPDRTFQRAAVCRPRSC